MKLSLLLNRSLKTFSLALLTLMLGCGGGGNNANPAPSPSNPAGTATSPVAGTNCPVISGGVPLNNNGAPFYGSLQSNSAGAWGNANSLTLNLSFTNYTGPGSTVQNLVGSGSFVFPDLSYLLGTQTSNSNLCVSSNNIGSAGYNPGTFNMGNGSLSLTLNGAVQVPLYNPLNYYPGTYQSYPTTNQTGQDIVKVNIGWNCPAYISNNRIVGCVSVRVGNSPYGRVMNYYSR